MKNFKISTKFFTLVLSLVLIAAMALTFTACGEKLAEGSPDTSSAVQEGKVTELGQGSKQFYLVVTDKDNNQTGYSIKTDKKTVGEALLELEIIDAMYIKSVNGIVADYDVDKTYWGFFINGEYAMTGVDSTDIENGQTYELKVSK